MRKTHRQSIGLLQPVPSKSDEVFRMYHPSYRDSITFVFETAETLVHLLGSGLSQDFICFVLYYVVNPKRMAICCKLL